MAVELKRGFGDFEVEQGNQLEMLTVTQVER